VLGSRVSVRGAGGGMRRLATTDAGFEAAFSELLAEPREAAENLSELSLPLLPRCAGAAIRHCANSPRGFDRMTITPAQLRITAEEIDAAVAAVPAELHAALELAATRIEAFHRRPTPADPEAPGCRRG